MIGGITTFVYTMCCYVLIWLMLVLLQSHPSTILEINPWLPYIDIGGEGE